MFNYKQRLNHAQQLLTATQYRQLVKNHNANLTARRRDGQTTDFAPCVRFFATWSSAQWILSELDPETGIAFGLCDLGTGFPELGYVSLCELVEMGRHHGRMILMIERDLHYSARDGVAELARQASEILSVSA